MPHKSVTDKKLYDQLRYHKRNDAVKGWSCDLKVQDILDKFMKQDGKCFWSGIPMTLPDVGRRMTDISLDRVDCNKGHTKDNTVLTCQAVNFCRNSFTEVELLEFLELIRQHNA